MLTYGLSTLFDIFVKDVFKALAIAALLIYCPILCAKCCCCKKKKQNPEEVVDNDEKKEPETEEGLR